MSSVTPLTKTKTFNGDISASDEVNAADLDTQIARCYQMGQEIIAALDRLTDGADALRNRTVGLLQLKTEVLNALEGLPTPLQGVQTVATSNVALSGLQTLNGHTLIANDRVVLVGQTDQRQNGLWVAAAGAWSRPSDFASASTPEQYANVEVLAGSQLGAVYALNTASVTVDTTDQVWIQIQAANNGTTKWLLSNYSTLTAALTSIGATPGTLIIDTTATMAGATAFPSTLSLEFTRAGKLVTGTYAATGVVVVGDPQHQIFDVSGGGSVALGQDALPEWFGAVADGTVDCTAAITAALASVASATAAVRLSAGTYRITSAFAYLSANARVIGAGMHSTTIDCDYTSPGSSSYPFKAVDVDDILLQGFTLDMQTLAASSPPACTIRFEGCHRVVIRDVKQYHPYNGGFLLTGPQFFGGSRTSDDCLVEDCLSVDMQYYNQSTGWAHFIAAGGSSRCRFVRCRVESSIGDGFGADRAPDTHFDTCVSVGGASFTAEGQQAAATRVTWSNCHFDGDGNSDAGYFISENVHATIVGGTVENITSGASTGAGVFAQCLSIDIIGVTFRNIDNSGGFYGGGPIQFQPTKPNSPWNAGTDYEVGDYVSDSGAYYKCIQAHTNQAPPNLTYWQRVYTTMNVTDCIFVDNTFDLTLYNAGTEPCYANFSGCKFHSAVVPGWASGAYHTTMEQCVFLDEVAPALTADSTLRMERCIFHETLHQGTNGLGRIRVSHSRFIEPAATPTNDAISVNSGNTNPIVVVDCYFYGWLNAVTGTDAREVIFDQCVFDTVTNEPALDRQLGEPGIAGVVEVSAAGVDIYLQTRGACLLLLAGVVNGRAAGVWALAAPSGAAAGTVAALVSTASVIGTAAGYTVTWGAAGNVNISHPDTFDVYYRVIPAQRLHV